MTNMIIQQTKLVDCYEIIPDIYHDERGRLTKTFHQDTFAAHKLQTRFVEQYYSSSRKKVLRGLHFQLPPHQHVKLVTCLFGMIVDAVVDLRVGSPTYGQYALFDLSAEKGNMVYVPEGMAHGFYVVSESAIVVNNASSVYSPEYDCGIRWDSVGIPWEDDHPILSQKDRSLVPFPLFQSPFVYEK